MSNKILIITDTIYQMMFAKVIEISLNNKFEVHVCNTSERENVGKFFTLLRFNNVIELNNINLYDQTNNLVGKIWKQRKNFSRVKKIISNENYDKLILFKDTPLIQRIFIDICAKKNIKIILIQEGIALHQNSLGENNKKNFIKKKTMFIHKLPENVKSQGMNKKVNKILASNIDKIPFEKTKDKEIIELPRVLPLKLILKDLNLDLMEKPEFNNSVNNALYIGQPLSEWGIAISREEERELCKKLAKKLKEMSFDLIVKPHPREDISKYYNLGVDNITILQESYIPVELLVVTNDIKICFSIGSSASENINNWTEVPSFTLDKLLSVPLGFSGLNSTISLNNFEELHCEIEDSLKAPFIKKEINSDYFIKNIQKALN